MAITIYFIAFQIRFERQFELILRTSIQNTYEGPYNIIMWNPQHQPSSASLAWDFAMYNMNANLFFLEIKLDRIILLIASMLWRQKQD